jgi:ankyrin repeat protein
LQGGRSIGCDRTNTLTQRTHTHTHTHTHTCTHAHTHSHTHTNTNTHTQSGRAALHLAASEGHVGVAEALLKAGCNKDFQDTV